MANRERALGAEAGAAVAVGLAALLLVAACGGGGSPAPAPAPLSNPVAHQDSVAWREDLHFLAATLAERHKNAFFRTSRQTFEREVARIDSAIPRLDDAEIIFRFKRMVASIGDGHTGGPFFIPAERRLPLRFEWFSDGIAVVGAPAPYGALVGRRLVRVGDVGVSAAFDTLKQYDAGDNVWGDRQHVPRHLASATSLAATHLVAAGAPIRMVFASLGGGTGDTAVTFAWPDASLARVAAPAVQAARARTLPFSWRYESAANAVVVRYDECSHGPEFAAMTDTILRFADSAHVRRLIVDVRANPGGNTAVAEPLINGLRSRAKTLPGNSIFVLMGRGTYSSAMDFAIDMRQRVHAVLAGEPTGGTPNGYGEVRRFELPRSHLAFQYSTKYFGLDRSGKNTVEPDLPIATPLAAYLAKRDVVLEEVLKR